MLVKFVREPPQPHQNDQQTPLDDMARYRYTTREGVSVANVERDGCLLFRRAANYQAARLNVI